MIKGARGILKITLTSLIAALACTGVIYAATTVGNNITTGGTLDVTGASTFTTASSTGIVKFGQINSDTGSINFGDENLYTTGNIGIGTSSPYARLSVVGEIVGSYFTATSTTATSTFANGIYITSGCFRGADGNCITSGGGSSYNPASVAITGGTIQGITSFKFDDNNIKIGNGWMETGVQNVLVGNWGGGLDSNGNTRYITGTRNVCLGQLSCENTTTGSNNFYAGYSVGYDTNGVVGLGTHACASIYSSTLRMGNYDNNTCIGYQSASPKDYFTAAYWSGQNNTMIGVRTGFIGEIQDYADSTGVGLTALGYGASFGTNTWKYHSSDLSTSGTGTVQVNSVAHGFSDNDWIWFRDVTPDAINDANSGTSCALGVGMFRVKDPTADTFTLEWCRSLNGESTSADSSYWIAFSATAIESGCGAAAKAILFDTAYKGMIDAIPDNTPIKFTSNNCGGSIAADTTYYTCRIRHTTGVALSTGLLALKTTNDCSAANAGVNYVPITTSVYTADASLYENHTSTHCSAWTEPVIGETYTSGTVTYGFDEECDDVAGTAMVKVQSAVSDYNDATVIGKDAVANCSDCVVLGRPTDTVSIGGIGSVGGVLNTQWTSVGNVDGGTDNLMSYTLPAHMLEANGRTIHISAQGTLGNGVSGGANTLICSFGGSAIFTHSGVCRQKAIKNFLVKN